MENGWTERIKELEAEVAKLTAERDADRRREYGYSQQTVDALTAERDKLADENAKLRADIAAALRINNPCGHTGVESFACEICGYPDPRKMIAALKAEIEMGKKREDAMHERWKKATAKYPNGAEGCCCLFDEDNNQIDWCTVHAELRDERDGLKEDNERLREALNRIASWREGPRVTSSFDEPGSAEIARQALKGGGNESL